VTQAKDNGGRTVGYTYDSSGRLWKVVDSIAGTITRTWDGLDRLTSETTPEGGISYTYDAADRRTVLTLPNGVTVEYGYDDAS
jgi:YD repeat-containing protein